MKRGDFIKLSAGLAAVVPFIGSCESKKAVPGKIIGASSTTGHLLRDHSFEDPENFKDKNVVIIGAGISGLSAARHLFNNHVEDIVILDMEELPGGNSASGANAISKYPWGAHYIPLPNNDLEEYLSFLREADVISGYDEQGLPVYNEYFLCHDPEERLYINGRWQEGLVPNFGLKTNELEEFKSFFVLMDHFKHLKGKDGKQAFGIPVDTSSKDQKIKELDSITMKQWMDQNKLTCDYIRWYVNYCTRDDYGTNYETISAWVGIHYFASRKGKANNASYNDVLTWEQGNGFLVQALQKNIETKIKTNALAVSVKPGKENVRISYLDINTKKMQGFSAKHCIMAVPQFIAARLLADQSRQAVVKSNLHYVPWMVANLTVTSIQERSGQPGSWDNVIYDGPSLGYVDATHQQLQQAKDKRNLTYYMPLTGDTPQNERMKAFTTSHGEWTERILKDLQLVHPDIRTRTENVDIMLWGHAMVQPLPGMIYGDVRRQLSESVLDRIHFAHTDIAGVSIFEEGFYMGLKAAEKIIKVT